MKITIASLALAVSLPTLALADPVENVSALPNGTGASGQTAIPVPAIPSSGATTTTTVNGSSTGQVISGTTNAGLTNAPTKDVFGSPLRK